MATVLKPNFFGSQKFISAPDKVVYDSIRHCVENTGEEFEIRDDMKILDIFLQNPLLECLVYEELLRRGYEELTLKEEGRNAA